MQNLLQALFLWETSVQQVSSQLFLICEEKATFEGIGGGPIKVNGHKLHGFMSSTYTTRLVC